MGSGSAKQLNLPLMPPPGPSGLSAAGCEDICSALWLRLREEGAEYDSIPDLIRSKALALADSLRRRLGYSVRVFITDNRSSLMNSKWDDKEQEYIFRMHHMFLYADEQTVDALADFGAGNRRKSAGQKLGEFIEKNRHLIRKDSSAGPRAPAPPQGLYHDLQEIFDKLNEEYFGGEVAARIGWGSGRENVRRGRRKKRRSIKMGSYVHGARLIRVHPALDRPDVPDYYVAWVVYHEMLHQVVPPLERGGKKYYHSASFKRRENAYRDIERARQWEDLNLEMLLGF